MNWPFNPAYLNAIIIGLATIGSALVVAFVFINWIIYLDARWERDRERNRRE